MEISEHNWIPSQILDAHATELVMRLKEEKKTIAQLQSEWEEDGMGEESFLKALRAVGLIRALV